MVVGGLGNADGVGVSGEMVVGRRACAGMRAGVRAGVMVSLGRGRGLRWTGVALDGPVVVVMVVLVVVTPAY